MKPRRQLNRRSFIGQVAGGVAVGGGALSALTGTASAWQVTDRDPYDPAGQGRGGAAAQGSRSGYSDSDSGPGADPVGYGRRGAASGVTDSDSGAGADPVGRGRGAGTRPAYQDSDNADPVGNARRPPDSDYVDCRETQRQLAMLERQIEAAEWDSAQLAQAQADLARGQQLRAENPGSDYSSHREIQAILERYGIDCNFTDGGGGCLYRLEELVRAGITGRQNRPQLYGLRYRLQEDLRRGACGPG